MSAHWEGGRGRGEEGEDRGKGGGWEEGGLEARKGEGGEREGKRGVLVRTELLLLQLCVEDVLLSASPRRMEAVEPDLLSLMEYLPAAEELGSKLAGMERWVWVGHVSAGVGHVSVCTVVYVSSAHHVSSAHPPLRAKVTAQGPRAV